MFYNEKKMFENTLISGHRVKTTMMDECITLTVYLAF